MPGPMRLSRFVAVTMVLVVISSLLAFGQTSDDDCRRCHGDFMTFDVQMVAPAEVPVGAVFEVTVTAINHADNGDGSDDDIDGHPYEIRDIQAELNASGEAVAFSSFEEPAKTTPNIPAGESSTITWTFEALEPGTARIDMEFIGTAYYDHETANPDEGTYFFEEALEITVIEAEIRLSSYSLRGLSGQRRSFEMLVSAVENVTFVTFTPSPEISRWVRISSSEPDWDGAFERIEAGGHRLVAIEIDADGSARGELAIEWITENGTFGRLNLTVVVLSEAMDASEGTSWLGLAGRITGMIEIPLAAASIVLGGFPKQARKWLKGMGHKRFKIHCYVSYTILALALFHLAVLLAGPYGYVGLTDGMMVGILALAFVVGLAINGALTKFFIKTFGGRMWRLQHQLMSLGFIITMTIHMVMLGTEFAFLRG